jgi:hypothetical protein
MDILKNWVFDEDDYLGADTITAFKMLPNSTRIYASVVREIFDKKAESKTLRFFYSGPPGHDVESFGSKWTAITKKRKRFHQTLCSRETTGVLDKSVWKTY